MLSPLLCLVLIPADVSQVSPGPIRVSKDAGTLTVHWPDERGQQWRAVFSLDSAKPLIRAIAGPAGTLIQNAKPLYWAETGKRRGGFDQFFDFPPAHPEGTRRFLSSLDPVRASAHSRGNRVELRFDGLKLGVFSGAIVYTFYPGSRLVKQEAVASTSEPDTAYYYDAGLQWAAPYDRRAGGAMQTQLTWYDTAGRLQQQLLPFFSSERQPVAARYRVAATRTPAGSLAVFPAPHQYFMPRDFTSNLGFVWAHSFRGQVALGIRQLPDEHWIFYPWMNAPPGTSQRMAMFLMLSAHAPAEAIEDVLRFTNRDRFPPLPGYKTLAAHWHFAYTVQAQQYGEQWVPPFKPVLKDHGIDIAMIADFHGDGHPRDTGAIRLRELEDYYRFCKAQSDRQFLIVPAEEANVHLGGHYVIAFPKPVRWYLSRQSAQPFVESGVYRVNNSRELLDLARRENALIYTAHPRTKGSLDFPDKYKDTNFFRDPHFLGAGWKQMPADMSSPRLGVRSLNLLDDMLNWGLNKQLIAEVDVFQIDSTHDLYPHLNVNYVRLDELPAFDQYGQVLEPVRRGEYFVSTGEVLLPSVTIQAGIDVRASVRWTFPLAQAIVVWGDGVAVNREVIALEDTPSHTTRTFS